MADQLEKIAIAIAVATPERLTKQTTRVPSNLIRALREKLEERYDLKVARQTNYRGPVRWYGDPDRG